MNQPTWDTRYSTQGYLFWVTFKRRKAIGREDTSPNISTGPAALPCQQARQARGAKRAGAGCESKQARWALFRDGAPWFNIKPQQDEAHHSAVAYCHFDRQSQTCVPILYGLIDSLNPASFKDCRTWVDWGFTNRLAASSNHHRSGQSAFPRGHSQLQLPIHRG